MQKQRVKASSDHLTVQGLALHTKINVADSTGNLLILTGADTDLPIVKVLFNTASH